MTTRSYLPVSPGSRRYGLFPDNPKHPAKILLRLEVPYTIVLPPAADLSQWMGPIRDQGQEGSCTGQMGAEIRDFLYRKLYVFEKNKTVAPAGFLASASFVYKCNLIADGDLGTDAGSSIHQTFITLNQKGACLNTQEPYSDADYSVAPTAADYAAAQAYLGGPYHSLPDLLAIKACLASGYSVGFGIQVYESFEGAWTVPGLMPMPNTTAESLLGGHAQHIIGYDDSKSMADGSAGGLYLQNSWGSGWGISAPGRTDGGTYWMPYTFINAGLWSDAWCMHEGKPW
jgi:C1A family cysteine protease